MTISEIKHKIFETGLTLSLVGKHVGVSKTMVSLVFNEKAKSKKVVNGALELIRVAETLEKVGTKKIS